MRRYTQAVQEEPDPTWSAGEISRLADNSIKSLAHRLALWETGEDTLTPEAYKRALEHLRCAIDRQEAELDPETRHRGPGE